MNFEYSNLFKWLGVPCVIILPNVPEFTIIDANEAYLDLVDLNSEHVISKGFFSVFPISEFIDELEWETLFDEVLKEKRFVSRGIKTWLDPHEKKTSIENVKYFEITHFPVFDQDGEVLVIVRSLIDVTDYVIDRRLLSEAQFDVRFGNWWINIEKRTIKWSVGMNELFETGKEFMPNFENVKQFYLHADDEVLFMAQLFEAIRNKRILKTFVSVRTRSGKLRRLKVVGKPDHLGDACIGIHGTAIDVTKQHEDQNILKEMYFLHNHELRAPLARIIGLAEHLRREGSHDQRSEFLLDALLDSANELDRIIRQIVDREEQKGEKDV
ncbi:histidine kinase dimerization/phospho-acceptor domain-containing protein [Sphingobacterium sp.]|uniref:histidine kinase dimerization/phospho-acceptor domain-containing protein n=1 Tax=Sphingobacterium TaxID=28453 RepID=UPI0028ABE10B|nr:histidine kinase dimerization/phospho-acceptor domain-containing protein [Sphingobacterium sp.]